MGGRGIFSGDNNPYVSGDGQLTEHFRGELREIRDQEAEFFEAKLKSARPADRDLFGIKRRDCEVCGTDCSGYEPTKQLFGGRGEFPTFCRHCGCPAHFHKVEGEAHEIPVSLTDLLTGRNIQTDDLNYNCVFAAFHVKGPDN